MVYKTDIKGLDFTTMREYEDYAIQSVLNGQRSQAKDLIQKMSKEQKKAFLSYLDLEAAMYWGEELIEDTRDILIELI